MKWIALIAATCVLAGPFSVNDAHAKRGPRVKLVKQKAFNMNFGAIPVTLTVVNKTWHLIWTLPANKLASQSLPQICKNDRRPAGATVSGHRPVSARYNHKLRRSELKIAVRLTVPDARRPKTVTGTVFINNGQFACHFPWMDEPSAKPAKTAKTAKPAGTVKK